jgi:nitroimidazol reductase NimA-like FMN-containing flavoprotein (pyridoxamine 5'-phosphate oxidase superfamily)
MTSLRRAEKEIRDRAEVEAVLREAEVGRLGTSVDGRPYVVPVNFAYIEGRIFFHGAGEGKKLRDIAENPRVCFEVDEAEVMPAEGPCDYSYRYRSVIANGRARVLTAVDERADALRAIVEKYAEGKGAEITRERMERFTTLAVVEIEVDEMTGKRSPAP